MSLVGTRPPTVDEWDKYDLHHRARLATKPGMDWFDEEWHMQLVDYKQFKGQAHRTTEYESVGTLSDK